jgi:creatinine amidohydrolase/Fe(II)-dependent formamide hydrolase-like protein
VSDFEIREERASCRAVQTVFELAGATWMEVEAHPRLALLVPLGSLEQHGPHLPLSTDACIASAIALRAAAGRPGVAVAPALAFGASGEHAGFPGTLSIGTRALCDLLVELARDASRDWSALLLVNGHGGNRDAVERAIARLRTQGVRAVSPTAVLGDPREASAAEGRVLLGELADACSAALESLLAGSHEPLGRAAGAPGSLDGGAPGSSDLGAGAPGPLDGGAGAPAEAADG